MPPPRKRRLVALDNLSWKPVAVPERLDDAEGFYGLEEIDDVEIVRDTATNSISFHTAADHSTSEAEWEGLSDTGEHSGTTGAQQEGDKTQPGKKSSEKPAKAKAAKTKKVNAEIGVSSNRGANSKLSNDFSHLEARGEEAEADVSAWSPLGLSADLMIALARMSFSKPTKIQQASIPAILGGEDVIGKASTGSGKTLAYGIPILEYILSHQHTSQKPGALVLAPTRELAHQIQKHLSELSGKLPAQGPRLAAITGGLSVFKQQRQLKDADIVIATPGRLWEVINSEQGLLRALRGISYLVVDEADRLLSEGHYKELEEILNSLDRTDVDDEEAEEQSRKPKRQTLVFSATFQKDLRRKLAGKSRQAGASMMDNAESMDYLLQKLNFKDATPKYIDVNPVSQMAENLREGLVECGANEKDLYLYALLLHFPKTRTLIFTNSITASRRIAPFLQNLGLQVQALHSQMPQKARLRAIERFSSQDNSILVATDVAARGLDIPHVGLVVHYHVPRQADIYVHRSGRSARAENAGSSIMLCAPDEVVPVRRLVAKVHAQNASQAPSMTKAGTRFFIHSLDIDRQVINRLKKRADMSKKISDVELAKEKHRSEDNWLKKAADDLGVDYDSEEFAKDEAASKGMKGKKRREKESEERNISKHEVSRMKAQLKDMLAQRVNVGVSERYLTAGGIDIDQLMREQNGGQRGLWLGKVDGLGF